MKTAQTKTHTARKLLEHGALSMGEFKEITGWPQKQAINTLKALMQSGVVIPVKSPSLRIGTNLYALASSLTADGCMDMTKPTQQKHTTDIAKNYRGYSSQRQESECVL